MNRKGWVGNRERTRLACRFRPLAEKRFQHKDAKTQRRKGGTGYQPARLRRRNKRHQRQAARRNNGRFCTTSQLANAAPANQGSQSNLNLKKRNMAGN